MFAFENSCRNKTANGENYGRLLEWRDSKNRVHSWAMPIELAHSDSNEHIKYLVSRGLEVIPNRSSREKVSRYIAVSKPTETRICTNKIGWHNNLFVLPNETIGQTEKSEAVIFQSASGLDHRFEKRGNLSDWQQNISRLCVGNSRLVFAVSVAFASCLLSPLQENGGGGFHLRGASSVGKSTALFVAGSVWGGDAHKGFLNTWRTTANGLEAVAELHNDSFLCLDELKECEPKTASEVAYMLANGIGKGRMNKNIYARKSLTWTLLFLSSGELSLADMVEQNGGRTFGGQDVRMCDISADAESGFGLFENLHEFPNAENFARQLTENAKKFYGTAIIKFLEYVSANLEEIKTSWQNFRQKFMQKVLPKDANGEIQRVASRFALVAFGGSLAYEVCGWSKDEAFRAAQKIFQTWLAGRGTNGHADAENAIRQVRYFLESHGAARFQSLDLYEPERNNERISNRVGFKRKNNRDETEYLIFPENFRKDVCKGFDASFVATELDKRKFLEKDAKTFAKQIKIDGKNQRFYVINSNIFETE